MTTTILVTMVMMMMIMMVMTMKKITQSPPVTTRVAGSHTNGGTGGPL